MAIHSKSLPVGRRVRHAARMLATMALLALAIAGQALAQQAYPSRPVRLLVGFAPGGGADALARAVAARLGEQLGQQVVVENRPGASGTVAAEALANAAPDGYTLYFADTSILIAASAYAKVGYDPKTSFAAVGSAAELPLVLVVNPSFPARSIEEFIATLKANPGKYAFATSGVGSIHHLAAELLMRRAGIEMTHVPYKGASQILPDLISGQVPIALVSSGPAIPQVKAGRIRAIALTSPARLADAPDWRALSEVLPGFDASPRLFVLAPAGTPAPIVQRLANGLEAALAAPELLETFAKQGATVRWSNSPALAAELDRESERWAALVRSAKIRLD